MSLTVRDVARYLGVSEKTVYRWIQEGKVPLHRVDGEYRFNRTELLEWANARNLKVSTAIYRREESDDPLPSVAEAIEAGGILRQLPGTDKASVLRSMVDALGLPEQTDREMLYQIILARERIGSTAIGKGMAIPHVRSPIVLSVSKPRITLCFLEHSIDFEAPDGLPIHTLFWLVTPNVRAHTHMLTRLALLLKDSGFVAVLDRRAPTDVILNEARRVEAGLDPAKQAPK